MKCPRNGEIVILDKIRGRLFYPVSKIAQQSQSLREWTAEGLRGDDLFLPGGDLLEVQAGHPVQFEDGALHRRRELPARALWIGPAQGFHGGNTHLIETPGEARPDTPDLAYRDGGGGGGAIVSPKLAKVANYPRRRHGSPCSLPPSGRTVQASSLAALRGRPPSFPLARAAAALAGLAALPPRCPSRDIHIFEPRNPSRSEGR